MTMADLTTSADHGAIQQPTSLVHQLLQRQRALAITGMVLLAMMIPSALALLVDNRVILDVNVWQKPLKFQLSVGTYLLTLAWFMAYASHRFQSSAKTRFMVGLLVTASLFEVLYISWQALLGEASHFNVGDSFHSLMYSLMGLGALTMTTTALILGIAVLRHHTGSLPGAFRLSVGLGLVLTFFLGTLAGVYTSVMEGPLVGALSQSKAGGLPLLGWSRDVGDLRVSHFFGIHAMHILPVVGWLVRRRQHGLRVVWLSAIALTALTLFSFVQALAGQPFLPIIGG